VELEPPAPRFSCRGGIHSFWKDIAMTRSKRALALASAIAVAVTAASPSFAGPVLSSASGVKAAASDNVVDVRWRRGGGVAAGFAAGALAGAVIGAATAPRYYGYPYAYGYPAYGAYAYEAPVYSAPVYGAYYGAYGYPGQTCGAYGGYGRWDYSNC
jgi:hypothetical protein